ncbi:unnamed protein product [Arctogadus glacialis]
MRSKSVDNFFQRGPNNNLRLPPVIEAHPPPPLSSPPPPFPESPLAYERSPSLSSSASPDPSLSSCSPNTSPSATLTPAPGPAQVLLRPVKTHCFQDHVFRKPTCCERCKQMIQGNSKQGIRCKTCKLGAHLWCSSELSTQPCNGKLCACRLALQCLAFEWRLSPPRGCDPGRVAVPPQRSARADSCTLIKARISRIAEKAQNSCSVQDDLWP